MRWQTLDSLAWNQGITRKLGKILTTNLPEKVSNEENVLVQVLLPYNLTNVLTNLSVYLKYRLIPHTNKYIY